MSEPDLTLGQDLGKVLAELEALRRDNSYLRMRVSYLESGRDKCKVSKWTKVKGALGWEKDKEELLTLKVPNSSSDPSSSISVSPAGSCLSHSSLGVHYRPPLLSSSSSEEDLQLEVGRRCASTSDADGYGKNDEEARRSKSLDGEAASSLEHHLANKKLATKDINQKGHKTPWSKVKGIIHNTKGVRKRSHDEKRDDKWAFHVQNEGQEMPATVEEDSDMIKLLTPKLTVTLPSNEELCSDPNVRKQNFTQKLDQNQELSPPLLRKSKWFKVRSVFLQGSRSAPSSPIRSDSFIYDVESDEISSGDIVEEKEDEVFQEGDNLRYEIEVSYAQLQSRLTDEFTRKMESIAERRRAENRETNRERDLSPDFKKKLEEWDRMKQGKELSKEVDKEKLKNKISDERLKKMRVCSRQEVLIPTSTGMFRFEGISDKFTRRLYEWEQARGITPEESTFVLLDPEYKPTVVHNSGDCGVLVRSKSIGSIAGPINSSVIAQQPSSLSLNDMDELQGSVPGSILAELEDVATSDSEAVRQSHVFGYAPEEVTRLIDSSSESDKEINNELSRRQAVNSSYQLLQENISLLDKLKKERDACRRLEDDMRLLEGQIYNVSKSFDEPETNETKNSEDNLNNIQLYEYEQDLDLSNNMEMIANNINGRLSPVREFTVKLEDFKTVQTTMVDDESTQTQYIFHNQRSFYEGEEEVAVHDLIRELLDMADRLESAVVERDKEMLHIKSALYRKEMACDSDPSQYSSFTLPVHWLRGRRSQELSRLPKQITNKILELKQIFNSVTSTPDLTEQHSFSPPRVLQRSVAQEDLSPDYRPSSQASSSASSFSYHHPHGTNGQDWAYTQQYNYKKTCPMVQVAVLSDPVNEMISEGGSDSVVEANLANVFVQTTRKIFSPVNECEAIGLIIAEEEEAEEIETEVRVISQPIEEQKPKEQSPKLRAQSSSPMIERKPRKFSSFSPLSELENGVVNAFEPLPVVEELKLGDELTSSLKLRALKIQKAKEEFLRGREGSLTIVVEDLVAQPTTLLVKSASAGIVSDQNDEPTTSRAKNESLLTLLRKKLKKEGAVASLARQSIEVSTDPSQTKSCPSSPVLNKKNESTSWIRNPAKIIFRPKGKYKINNK